MARDAGLVTTDRDAAPVLSTPYPASASAARCLAGDSEACLDALAVRPSTYPQNQPALDPEAAMPPGFIADLRYTSILPVDVDASRLLADMARDLGPGRFARFWTSDAAPYVAFSRATGGEMGAWTHDWLASGVRPPTVHPRPSLRNVVWLALALPLLLLAAVRRRDSLVAAG